MSHKLFLKYLLIANLLIVELATAQLYTPGAATNAVANGSTTRVGVGTASPESRLHIANDTNGEQLRFTRGTGVVRFTQEVNFDNLYLRNGDGSQTYMYWKENGNIGIGTQTVHFRLHALSTVPGVAAFSTTATGNTGNISILNESNWNYGVMGIITGNGTASGDVYGLGYSQNANSSFNSVLTWTSSGKVGIGKSNPEFKLDIADYNQLAVGKTYVDNTVDADNGYVRSNFGSNAYWDAANNRWQVKAIGANDFSSIIHPNQDGFAFIAAPSDGNVAKSLTHSQFMSFEKMRIKSNGDVGIGTASPASRLHLYSPNSTVLRFERLSSNVFGFEISGSSFGLYDYTASQYKWRTASGNLYLAEQSGNVGIGTTITDAKLTVKGDIHTKEVRVDVTGAMVPDYVFEPDYDLATLVEIETYIKENKHLPEVPSAKEMEENGMNLKEMNLILLKKVEELTLHLIEQSKVISEITKELEILKKR